MRFNAEKTLYRLMWYLQQAISFTKENRKVQIQPQNGPHQLVDIVYCSIFAFVRYLNHKIQVIVMLL